MPATTAGAPRASRFSDGGRTVPRASGGGLCVLVLLSSSSGSAAAGCVAAATEVPTEEAGAPDPVGREARAPGPPAPCDLPRGFSAGAPPRFPALPAPAIGHRPSAVPGDDAFGRFLRSTVVFCGPDEQAYFVHYRFYLTGPFSGRWLRPPLVQPL
ncbi:hypothetical protein [Sorangium sp. So ce1000]|uniref:hypothetical protein n=1 Tax=Sorangium sp. So ce1000 TaxID=3133325 RepID=UPI003F63B69E